MNNNAIKILALTVAVMLVVSVTTNAYAESKEKKKDIKKAKKIVNKIPKKIEQKPLQTNVTAPVSTTPPADPMQEKLAACKAKETQREQYECEKALKAISGDDGFKSKATKTVIGPITFYYAGAKVEKTGGNDIVNLRFLVENTGSKDNVSLYCTGPAVCNYDVSDGTTTYKYASQDFTNGQIVLKPGASRTFNMLFGPAIGYGSYVDFKFDPSKQYTFNVKEPWGSGKIPLNLK
ncbi:MAG: hypothetical protein EB150_05760 [Nitrososphaeria archaeon]|nr:hypothetical protein [Nitrososphaeria archaeon]NDB88324.1 hypothetical protein [Nitrososphaerota archaeon]NDF27238.1 hypothetical protein [Nitrosopumilaceae archaeon]NDB46823.1 hypothetical protein [Nitrososphaeria archaeon]NDB90551.1 hypothetical protein [Nitrososphaerota archaeon]